MASLHTPLSHQAIVDMIKITEEKIMQKVRQMIDDRESGKNAMAMSDMMDEKMPKIIEENFPVWNLVCSMILLNLQMVRTDRHGSPFLVVENTRKVSGEPDYILVTYAPLMKLYLGAIVPRLNLNENISVEGGKKKTKKKPLFPNVANLWAKFSAEFSDRGYFAYAKSILTGQQLADMRMLWGADKSPLTSQKVPSIVQFKKKILAICGVHMESWLRHACTDENSVMERVRKGWTDIPQRERGPGSKNNVSILIDAARTFNVIHIPGSIPTRITYLVSTQESRYVLERGFSGLGQLLRSPSLNGLHKGLDQLDWKALPLRADWVTEGKSFPMWKDVIQRENPLYTLPLDSIDSLTNTIWWQDGDGVAQPPTKKIKIKKEESDDDGSATESDTSDDDEDQV